MSQPDDGTALLVLTLICGSAIGLAWLLAREVRRATAELQAFRERAQKTIEEARAAAEKTKAATNVLLGTVSHELKPPLQTVLASIKLLEEEQSRSWVDTFGTMPRLRRAADALEAQLAVAANVDAHGNMTEVFDAVLRKPATGAHLAG